jgi:hypothetical protein
MGGEVVQDWEIQDAAAVLVRRFGFDGAWDLTSKVLSVRRRMEETDTGLSVSEWHQILRRIESDAASRRRGYRSVRG